MVTPVSSSPGARERQRVRRHLVGAERMIAARRPRLTALQALNRRLLLEELGRYRRSGRFPLNHDSAARPVPLFIDAHGTPCAVAQLMNISGQGELVRHIARTDNTVRVRRLAAVAEVKAWLAAAGLSLAEAARIQPAYCRVTEAEVCFCEQSARTGLALGAIVSADARSVEVTVQRSEGELAGLAVGERVSVMGSGELGEQILFRPGDEAGAFYRASQILTLEGDVRCQLNQRTAKRPVSIDTAFEALLAGQSSCVDVLRAEQSAWEQSQCIESDDGGCGIARDADLGSAGLTSAAILVALVSYRRQRRAR